VPRAFFFNLYPVLVQLFVIISLNQRNTCFIGMLSPVLIEICNNYLIFIKKEQRRKKIQRLNCTTPMQHEVLKQ